MFGLKIASPFGVSRTSIRHLDKQAEQSALTAKSYSDLVEASGEAGLRRIRHYRDSSARAGVGSAQPLSAAEGWNPRHGTWYFQYDHADAVGTRVVVSFGSLATRAEAEDQLAAVRRLLGIADELGDDPVAVAELRVQIAARKIRADHKAGVGCRSSRRRGAWRSPARRGQCV